MLACSFLLFSFTYFVAARLKKLQLFKLICHWFTYINVKGKLFSLPFKFYIIKGEANGK